VSVPGQCSPKKHILKPILRGSNLLRQSWKFLERAKYKANAEVDKSDRLRSRPGAMIHRKKKTLLSGRKIATSSLASPNRSGMDFLDVSNAPRAKKAAARSGPKAFSRPRIFLHWQRELSPSGIFWGGLCSFMGL